jgi:hypothetical protein
MNKLDTLRLKQYSHESKAWERLLYFFKQENVFLKTRLSEVLDNRNDTELLVSAEYFQNHFILKDELIDKLLQEIHEQEKDWKENLINNSPVPYKKQLDKKEKLRAQMQNFKENFQKIEIEFNKYVIPI